MRHAPIILLIVLVALLSGCASTKTVAPGYENTEVTLGEDSLFQLSASNLTRGEVPQLPPTVVMNAKGNKVLAVMPADPLAGILTAQNLNVKIGKNQSNAFGKAIGAINNYLMAATAIAGLKEQTAQVASNNGLKAAQAKEATAQVGLQTAPTVYAPAEQAVSRAGGAVAIP